MFRALLSCVALYLISAIAAGNALAQCAAYTVASGPTTFCQGSTGPTLSTTWHPSAACTASAYQWQIKNAGVWTNISGASGSTYTPTAHGFHRALITVTSSPVPIASDSISITVNPPPTVSLSSGASAQICTGSAIYTTSVGATAYQWSLNATPISGAFSTFYVPSVAGIYTCTVYGSNGCSASASTTITLKAVPPAPTVVTPVNYCQYDTTLPLPAGIAPGGAAIALWYSAATGGTMIPMAPWPITTSPGTTNYWVSQTINGCESPRAQITVNVHGKPPAPGASANTPVCAGSTLQLSVNAASAPAGSTFSWTGSNGFSTAPTTTGTAARANATALMAGTYYATTTSALGCASTDSVLVAVTCLDSVWSGDANYDKIVDNTDALEIALAMGSTGPPRSSGTSIIWQPEHCPDWTTMLPSFSSINRKHADCDGDSTVTLNDTLAVTTNYGLTHPKGIRNSAKKTAGLPDLYFDLSGINPTAGQTISVPIKLGTAITPAPAIAGIAARLMIDGLVPADTPSLSYAGSWLGGSGDVLHFAKAISNNRVDWAYARTDQHNNTGAGILAWLTFTLPAGASGQQMRLYFDEVIIVDSSGAKYTAFNTLEDSIEVLPATTGISAFTAGRGDDLMITPNPSSGPSSAMWMSASGAYRLELRSLDGKLAWQSSGKGKSGLQRVQLPADKLSAGVYLVSLHIDGRAVARAKWVKE